MWIAREVLQPLSRYTYNPSSSMLFCSPAAAHFINSHLHYIFGSVLNISLFAFSGDLFYSFKGKFCHHLPTLFSFQICMDFYLLLNKRRYFEGCWKSNSFGFHWLLFYFCPYNGSQWEPKLSIPTYCCVHEERMPCRFKTLRVSKYIYNYYNNFWVDSWVQV